MTRAPRGVGRPVARAAWAFLILWPCAGLAQTVRRGPYLQSGTPQSVVVRWRTDVPTASRVRYGASPGNLTSFTDDPAVTTEHVVRLSALSPGTRYSYSVGTPSMELAGNDTSTFFHTSPATGTARPTRVWVVGDSGTANANAAAVRAAYEAFTGARHTDLWLMLGDNAYPDGTDAEYQAAVFDMYPALLRQSVLWPTLGNHDGHTADSGAQTGPYYDIFTLPVNGEAGGLASGTEAYYSFDFGNVHFICLESLRDAPLPFRRHDDVARQRHRLDCPRLGDRVLAPPSLHERVARFGRRRRSCARCGRTLFPFWRRPVWISFSPATATPTNAPFSSTATTGLPRRCSLR